MIKTPILEKLRRELATESASLESEIAVKSASSHKHHAGDITRGTISAARLPTLDVISAPIASVNFAAQQATSFRIENRTSDPGTPTVGQIWLRTDLP